ncbi:MAG: hypothetical protein ABR590_09620 [Spirochaetia bacterium]
MKTTVDIPSALYRRVKLHAASRSMSIREFLIECLQRGLDESDAVGGPEAGPVAPEMRLNIQMDDDGWPVITRSKLPDQEKT